MDRFEKSQLAEKLGITEIEITNGMNGYPKGLHQGFKGFENFDAARDFAKKINGEVVLLHKRNGWQLWESRGAEFGPLERTDDEFGDNIRLYRSAKELEDDIKEFAQGMKDDGIPQEDIDEYTKKASKILNEFQPGYGVVTYNHGSEYTDIVQLVTMEYSYDTHNWAIGVESFKNEEES